MKCHAIRLAPAKAARRARRGLSATDNIIAATAKDGPAPRSQKSCPRSRIVLDILRRAVVGLRHYVVGALTRRGDMAPRLVELSDAETEVLKVLWEQGPQTGRQLVETLAARG